MRGSTRLERIVVKNAGRIARLAPAQFLLVHRATIVNVSRIRALEPLSHGEYRIVLRDGIHLTSGRTYRERLDRLVTSSF